MAFEEPIVSVCIPTFERKTDVLEQAIESVLAQDFANFEVVVSDDCSRTYDIFDRLRKLKDDRIRVIRQPVNLGIAANFNAVINASKGKYIKPLCDDDLLRQSCLTTVATILRSHPLVVFCGDICQGEYRVGFGDHAGAARDRAEIIEGGLNWRLLGGHPVTPSHVAFTRDLWGQVGPYNERTRYSFDWDFYVKARACMDVARVQTKLVLRREWAGSVTCSSTDPFRNFCELGETVRTLALSNSAQRLLLARKCIWDVVRHTKVAVRCAARGEVGALKAYGVASAELLQLTVQLLRHSHPRLMRAGGTPMGQ